MYTCGFGYEMAEELEMVSLGLRGFSLLLVFISIVSYIFEVSLYCIVYKGFTISSLCIQYDYVFLYVVG